MIFCLKGRLNMKKVLCFLMTVLLVLLSVSLAENSLITGDILTDGSPESSAALRIVAAEYSFEMSLAGKKTDLHLSGRLTDEGDLLAGDETAAALLPFGRVQQLIAPIMRQLEEAPSYENAVYSSLFIQARQVEISAEDTARLTAAVLSAFPLLDRDGSLRAALDGVRGSETWATVTRYIADERQYPDTWMVQVNVFSPLLPALHGEVRSDAYGSNFEFALSRQAVTDWDETIAALSEAPAGGEDSGRLVRGFTMVYDSGTSTDLYLEADLFGFSRLMRLAVDAVYENDTASAWTAEVVLNDEEQSRALFAAKLESVPSNETPAVSVSDTDTVSLMDVLNILREKMGW